MFGLSRLIVTPLLLCIAHSVLGPSVAHGQDGSPTVLPIVSPTAPTSDENRQRSHRAGMWMQTFYRTKDVAGFKAAFADLEVAGGLELGSARGSVLGFFSEFFKTYPELLEQVVYPTDRWSENARETLGYIVVYSRAPTAAKMLRDLGEPEAAKISPKSCEEFGMTSAGELDFCWGYFFATGDTRAVRKIVTALVLKRPPAAPAVSTDTDSSEEAKTAVYNALVAQAAMWSLGSNGRNYAEVGQYLEQLYYDKGYTSAELPVAMRVISQIYPDKYESFEEGQSGALTQRIPLDEVTKRAASGDATAQHQLGKRYYDGAGVEKNYGEAASLFRKASQGGSHPAEVSLGHMYKLGHGFDRDYKEAARWYRKAADAGEPQGQLHLALLYAEGLGVQQDSKIAFELALRAAKQGLPLAQGAVGAAYENGRGVKQSNKLAYVWYSVASTNGLGLAEELKESIKGNLSEAEVKNADTQVATILRKEKP